MNGPRVHAPGGTPPNPPVVTATTPLMRQYLSIKGRHTDAILFFRMGDFYEMFFEDAETAARELDLTLTARDKNAGERVPLCGFPHQAAQGYIHRLLEKGDKVAICDQTEDPKESRRSGKAIVERAVTRVMTPGLVVEEEALDSRAPSFLASVARRGSRLGLAFLDISTGHLEATEVDGDTDASAEIDRLRPRELLVAAAPNDARASDDPLASAAARANPPLPVTPRPAREFEAGRAAELLKEQLGVVTLDGQGLSGMDLAVAAAGAALAYARENAHASLVHVRRVKTYRRGDDLLVDEATRRNLELFEATTGGRRGSLLDVLDGTVTPMGGRLVRAWLSSPLRSVLQIRARLDAVEAFLRHPLEREGLRRELAAVHDLPRIVGRVATSVAGPRELQSLRQSLERVPALRAAAVRCAADGIVEASRGGRLEELASGLDPCEDLVEELWRTLSDEPPVRVSDGGAIRDGFDPELDEINALARDAKGWIAAMEARERERTGIGSLKVRFNRVFGYYIEVTTANLAKVPADYLRKQTTAGGERYYTPELKTFEEKVLHAEEKRLALEQRIFEGLRARVATHAVAILGVAAAVAELDALAGFAERAQTHDWHRPQVDDGDRIAIEAGRHPVIERIGLAERFVPNDVVLDGSARLLILTGPNMAGKSTVMRQTALIVLMAQVGSFVPAARAEIGVVDRVFTRVGASDLLSRGQSTFMVEMSETANILNNATDRSLVIIDEIGRGTSTFDGVSIAWAVAEHLHDTVRAKTLFATHYHELTALAHAKAHARNFHIAVKEWNEKIVFLRTLVEGATSRSYGIQVARLAGLPEGVLARAREVLADMTGTAPAPRLPHVASGGIPAANPENANGRGVQGSLFAPPDDAIRAELRSIEIDRMTPLEALQTLARLKERA